HALFGERLSIDLDNALFDVCADIAEKYDGDKEAFTIDVIQKLAVEPDVTDADYKDINTLTNKLYNQAKETYNRKNTQLRELMFPQFERIKTEHGDKVQNIVIP